MSKKVFIALRMAGIAGQEKLSGIFRFLGDEHDWDVTLVRTASEFTPSRIRAALKEKYDGFIVSIPNTERTTALLAASTTPTIVMDIHDPELLARTQNIAFIRNSPEAIGRAAADALLAEGRCRSYAFIHPPTISDWSRARFNVFNTLLRDRGVWCHELASPQELFTLRRPIGVFVANDDRGYDTLEYCRAHRLRVPAHVVVMGVDNDVLICEHCRPTLSSIQPDFNEEGFLAAKMLSRMMAKPTQQPTTLFVGVKTIVHRASTAELTPAGKLVQKAITYIQKNAFRRISVVNVARHLGCSRRLIDLRFREIQGTTIGEMIITLRLEEAKRLLKHSNVSVKEIATACGYKNANSLSTIFCRRFGLSMKEYRAQEKEKV